MSYLIKAKYDKLKSIILNLGSLKIIVEGKSMEPTIKCGEVINIVPPYEIKEGSILLYKRRYDLLLHRVIKKERKLCMKGDNENFYEYIEDKDVLGMVDNSHNCNVLTTRTVKTIYKGHIIEFQLKCGILEKIEVYLNEGY